MTETAYSFSGIALVSLLVSDYDSAISFFVETLGFELTEDSPAISTASGEPKRWVTIRPPDASPGASGILLTQASDEEQEAMIGKQFAGRVGLIWHVNDFETMYQRLLRRGIEIVAPPRNEAYGRICVWKDLCGNKWDLIGPVPG